jgi:DMSO/TMAO reductase YedYZ molybdopterin-dependent catalytic subunit
MMTRRSLLAHASAAAILATPRLAMSQSMIEAPDNRLNLSPRLPSGTRGEATLDALPGKKPLIKLAYRPPNYETPIEYLRTAMTPNDAFFVRYHLAHIPEINPEKWMLTIGGEGASREVKLSLDELKQIPAVEVTAVCQCSGNRRGLFEPHVPGVEWGYGAMGCARWKGVRLKDVLDKAEIKKEAIEIVLAGADSPVVEKTPAFVKSLPMWKVVEETTLIAYEMNGEPLPHWNGFPARVIVPGWTATYWMKHLASIKAVTNPFDGFWMKSAYRIPVAKFPLVARFSSQETAINTPITEMMVNSLITSHADGDTVTGGRKITIGGIAWDAGYGISDVEVSSDKGATWAAANLGVSHGRYALRTFSRKITVPWRRTLTIMVRASNAIGQTQATTLIANPAGYHHNVIQTLTLTVA